MLRLEASLFVERIGGVVADVEMFYRYSSREILFFEETKATSLLRLFLTLSQFAFYLFIYPSLSFNPINPIGSICDRSLPLRKREEWSVEELNFWINNRVSFVSINRRIFLSTHFLSRLSLERIRAKRNEVFSFESTTVDTFVKWVEKMKRIVVKIFISLKASVELRDPSTNKISTVFS